ncbi:hypothetical protein ACLOJK_017681 [Asimina triloba]
MAGIGLGYSGRFPKDVTLSIQEVDFSSPSLMPSLLTRMMMMMVAEKTILLPSVDLKHIPLALEGSAFRNKYLDMDELMSYCSWFAHWLEYKEQSLSDVIPKAFRKTKLVKGISKCLINHLGLTLTGEDIQSVVDLMEPYGAISNGIDLLCPIINCTREAKFPHAVWAAGRGLIALLLPNFDELEYIWLQRTSWEALHVPHSYLSVDWLMSLAGLISVTYPQSLTWLLLITRPLGCLPESITGKHVDYVSNFADEDAIFEPLQHTAFTKITKARSEGFYGNVDTRSHLEKELVLCFGAHIAAQMLLPFGEENFMSAPEIDTAQEIATRMVIQYGWGPDDNPTIYFCESSDVFSVRLRLDELGVGRLAAGVDL